MHEQVVHQQCFCELFNRDTLLIPVPKCQPDGRSVWVARQLALAIAATGLVDSVWNGLRRVRQIERSSSAWMWQRPTVQQHFDSLAVIPSTVPPPDVVLVDDVITKGRTLIAAAMRLREVFPETRIRAFALVRTMGLVMDVERVFDPCEGEILWNGAEAHRNP